MADQDNTENTEPSQSGTSVLDSDAENTQAGMWTEPPVGADFIDANVDPVDIDAGSVDLADDASLEPPPEDDAPSLSSSSTMPIQEAEPSFAPEPLPPSPPPVVRGERKSRKHAEPKSRSSDLAERFPSIRPARGGRLIAFGAIALGTFVSGLVLSSLFTRSEAPSSPALAAPTRAIAIVATDAAATPARTAIATATPAASSAETPAAVADAATPEPQATPVAKPAKNAKQSKGISKKAAVARATTPSSAKSAKGAAKRSKTASAARGSAKEEALPWELDDPHSGPNSRVIHARSGNKSVLVNHNIAVTKADGKTVIGKLVDVKSGTVEVKAKGKRVRIAEGDVKDASNY